MTRPSAVVVAALLLLTLTTACGVGPLANPITANPTVAAAATTLAHAAQTMQPALATIQSGVATLRPSAQALLATVQSGVQTAAPSAQILFQTAQAGVQTTLPAVVQTLAAAATPVGPDRYVQLAQASMTHPIARDGLPAGAWAATLVGTDDLRLTLPIGVASSPTATVQQGQQQLAQAVTALFDGAPELARVRLTGTLPDGPHQTEQPALSITVSRVAYADGNGTPATLGHWDVRPHLQ
jgi:hypothetical protein